MECVWRSFFLLRKSFGCQKTARPHLAVKKLRTISVWSQNGGTFEKLHATQREKWKFSVQSQTSATNESFFFWERTGFLTLWLRDVIYWLRKNVWLIVSDKWFLKCWKENSCVLRNFYLIICVSHNCCNFFQKILEVVFIHPKVQMWWIEVFD